MPDPVPPESSTTRRGFFVGLLRLAAVGTLAGGAMALVTRRPARASNEVCINPQPRTGCRGCPALIGCGLPQALSLRELLRKG